MIWLLLAWAAPQDALPEPQTRAELDAVMAQYRAATFAVSFDANGRLSCTPSEKFNSATLSIQSCIIASDCARQGERKPSELSRCIDRAKPGLIRSYRRGWQKAHPQ